MADNDFIWDSNETNMLKPTQALFNDGYALDAVPTSSNINYLFNQITKNRILVGTIQPWLGDITAIPSGWINCAGESISKSNVNPTTYYGDYYENLFVLLWTYCSTSVVLPGGKGASANADWDANKAITVPNMAGRTVVGHGIGNSSFNTSTGSVVGAETVTLTESQLPKITPTVTDPGHHHAFTAMQPTTTADYHSGSYGTDNKSANTQSATTGITIEPFGGGQAHSNVQPSFVVRYIIKY